ncbi:MAG TPA: DUF5597 domain-containing protein [Bacteroidales bacterium]|nr:DUF5597 domain-containing protein [Bacteroidales bacterium]
MKPFFLLMLCALQAINLFAQPMPYLDKQSTRTRMMVDGKPFLMLAGELGNSSSSSARYMRPIWSDLKKMHLNSVLIPAYWEMIEPEEGKFNFELIDSMIMGARSRHLKIVFLWFGSWKNSMSCYAPQWVKENQQRFPRARMHDGSPVEILTPFSNENLEADINAFTAFMQHIKDTDKDRTVIMIQVENEIGMIPDARDYCDLAERAFNEQVPAGLLKLGNKKQGSWEEVFGKGLQTDELFMAWHFAQYTGKVAEAGKSIYNLPMYVNAALIRQGYKPGQYPSAGPLPHLIDIWKAAAPSIDLFSPDIYFRNFTEWAARYDLPGNPLFIPEVGNTQSMAQAFYAFGKHNAIGYSPFSIESVSDPATNQICRAYSLLEQLSPLILENQGTGTMQGFLLDSALQVVKIRLGKYLFTVKHEYSWAYAIKTEGETPRNGGLIIMLGPDEFVIAGTGVIVTFESVADKSLAGIGTLDEVQYLDGKWIYGRRMNGDQSHQGRHMHLPGGDFTMQKVNLYLYK